MPSCHSLSSKQLELPAVLLHDEVLGISKGLQERQIRSECCARGPHQVHSCCTPRLLKQTPSQPVQLHNSQSLHKTSFSSNQPDEQQVTISCGAQASAEATYQGHLLFLSICTARAGLC